VNRHRSQHHFAHPTGAFELLYPSGWWVEDDAASTQREEPLTQLRHREHGTITISFFPAYGVPAACEGPARVTFSACRNIQIGGGRCGKSWTIAHEGAVVMVTYYHHEDVTPAGTADARRIVESVRVRGATCDLRVDPAFVQELRLALAERVGYEIEVADGTALLVGDSRINLNTLWTAVLSSPAAADEEKGRFVEAAARALERPTARPPRR